MHALVSALVAAVLLTPLPASADPQTTRERLAETVDGYVRNRDFNGVVLVADESGVLMERAEGVSSLELNAPLRTDQVFRVGSLTKPLTAVLVLTLVRDGQLKLDGTLGEYLPELYAGTPVADATVEQLLSHTSGLKDVPGNYNDAWWRTTARQTFTPETFAHDWIKPELSGAVGQWRYNNNGFFLLGLIVERVTGQPYAEALRQRVFVPADMSHSGVYDSASVVTGLANGYSRSDLGVMERPIVIDPSVSFSAAGVYSTAEDLLAFSRALSGDRLLPADLKARMFTDGGRQYGLGWGVESWATGSADARMGVQTHTGSVPGYQSLLVRSDDQTVVIVLNNFWQGLTTVELGQDLFAVAHGTPARTPRKRLADLLTPLAVTGDLEAMESAFRSAPTEGDEAYDASEGALNALGYSLLRKGYQAPAIRVFEWNTAAHPQSPNVHDSLGEAYVAAGRTADARRSYETALRLDPSSASAKAALDTLRD